MAYTDTFSTPSNPAAAPWTANKGTTFTGDMQIASGVMSAAASADALAHYDGTFADDQYSKATIGGVSLSSYHYVSVRAAASGPTAYYLRLYAGTSIGLRKVVAGTITTLVTIAAAYANGDVMELRIEGNTLTGYQNGSAIPSVTYADNSSPLASGYPGLGSLAAAWTWDDWEGGDLGEPEPPPASGRIQAINLIGF